MQKSERFPSEILLTMDPHTSAEALVLTPVTVITSFHQAQSSSFHQASIANSTNRRPHLLTTWFFLNAHCLIFLFLLPQNVYQMTAFSVSRWQKQCLEMIQESQKRCKWVKWEGTLAEFQTPDLMPDYLNSPSTSITLLLFMGIKHMRLALWCK